MYKKIELSAETQRFVEEHLYDDLHTLALQSGREEGVDKVAALVQIAGYRAAVEKLPTWSRTKGLIYPCRLSMEQCSSETAARYKAGLVSGTTFADLTGGFGIDCYWISVRFRHAVYVERQEELCAIARHNFALLGRDDIEVCQADGTEYLRDMAPVDCLFVDPARRDAHGGKTVVLGACEPDLTKIEGMLLRKAGTVLAKLSPMLDIAQALRELHAVRAVHVVAVRNECKELLLLLSEKGAEKETEIHCVDLVPCTPEQDAEERADRQPPFVFSLREEADARCAYAEVAEEYLYEPNAAILKAGGFRCLAQRYGVKKLHPNSHLYTSANWIPDFPGRRFRVEREQGFGKRELKEAALLKQANLTVRNFPATAGELRKRLKITDGGDLYLFATTFADGRKALLRCRKA